MAEKIKVIGGGLAGSEAAYYLAKRGYSVTLTDIKPKSFTPAHRSADYGELVCSNSLKSDDVFGNACGLLKEEMRLLGYNIDLMQGWHFGRPMSIDAIIESCRADADSSPFTG